MGVKITPNMKDLEIRFKAVHDKLQLLVKKYQTLERENGRLQAQIEELKKEEQKIRDVSEKYKLERDILKMSAGTLDKQDKKELDKQLGRFIREIDKCIAQLS